MRRNTFAPLQVSFEIMNATNFEWESLNAAFVWLPSAGV